MFYLGTSTFRDACPSRVRGCRSAIRRLSEFVSEPCPTVSERLRGVRAVARLYPRNQQPSNGNLGVQVPGVHI